MVSYPQVIIFLMGSLKHRNTGELFMITKPRGTELVVTFRVHSRKYAFNLNSTLSFSDLRNA